MNIRNRIADRLSRIACWLRGHKWYIADTVYGVPGNRAAELQQQVWVDVCILAGNSPDDRETLEAIDARLNELSQLAGENWGHIWPKEKPDYRFRSIMLFLGIAGATLAIMFYWLGKQAGLWG